jgi:hypothetical protein
MAHSISSCHRARRVLTDLGRSGGSFQCRACCRQSHARLVQRPLGSSSHATVVSGALRSWGSDVRIGERSHKLHCLM